MAGPIVTPYIRRQISADSDITQPKLIGGWMLKHGVDTVRVTEELRAIAVTTGTFTSEVRYRYASVLTSQPGAWQTPGTEISRTTDGADSHDVDVSATTNMMWVQAALFGKQSAGMGQALAGLQSSVEGRSRLLAADEFEINPFLNSGSTAYVGVGTPFHPQGLSSLMFAFVFIGTSGAVTVQPARRSFDAVDTDANAWATIGSSHSTSASNELHNSGAISVTPGAVALYPVGFAFTTTTIARVRVLVAGKF